MQKRVFIGLLLMLALVSLVAGALRASAPMRYSMAEYERAKEISEEAVRQELASDTRVPDDIRVPILIYHNIRPDYKGESLWQKQYSITPDMLDQQLAYLHDQGYTVISMDQLSGFIRTGTTSPLKKPVVLTFDDGWESQFQYAFPLLKKYGYTATFYVYTKAIDAYPGNMTWDELRALQAAGMTIGDHTVDHPHLSGLTQTARKQEVEDARSELEQKLHTRVVHFASPYGYADTSLAQLLQADGFSTGRTTYKGTHQSEANRYTLRAYLVGRSFRDFTRYLEGK